MALCDLAALPPARIRWLSFSIILNTVLHGINLSQYRDISKSDDEGSNLVKNKHDITIRSSAAEYLTFIAATGDDSQSFEMRYEDENIWLTQKMLAALYDVSVSAINQHLKKIFDDNELASKATIRNFLIVQSEGSRQVNREVNESEMAQLQRLVLRLFRHC
jgi:hypothetical protein